MNAWDYYKELLESDIDTINTELVKKKSDYWEEIGQNKALEVFHEAASRVPAYGDFLKKNKIDHKRIRSIKDFKEVPEIDKKNYLNLYPLKELCWDGDISKINVIAVSSGSTGNPYFWPRDIWQELEVDFHYNLLLKYLFNSDKKTTLQVIVLAMGMYIAGPFTFSSSLRFALKGNPLTITTPSTDIEAALSVIKNLASQFEQVLICGYPPLVKEIIDIGARQGLDWSKYNMKFTFGGEGFSEKWRDYIHEKINTEDVYATTINLYGTADASVLGIETPMSISFRRILANDKDKRLKYLGDERLPSIVSYNPIIKYFEKTNNGDLLFTSSSGLPVIRYRIGDSGGIVKYDELKNVVAPVKGYPDWKLPVVYLFGRSDNTVQVYGANVYPDNIKEALFDEGICDLITGRFLISIKYRENLDTYLNIEVELAPDVNSASVLKKKIEETITNHLIKNNSEYEVIFKTVGVKAIPSIELVKYRDERFKYNIKPKWIEGVNKK